MRLFIGLLGFALFGAEPAVFDGIAVDSTTQKPLAGVHIRLATLKNPEQDVAEAYGATSDRAGHFSIPDLPPGPYLLLPQFRGYLYVPKSAPAITLKPGQHLEFRLELTPRATITGHVLDTDGEPVKGVWVLAEAVSPGWNQSVHSDKLMAATDERGYYPIRAFPGKFYLRASGANRDSAYFPSSSVKELAVPVEARAGAEVSGFDIRIAAQAPQSFAISGVVKNIPEGERGTQVTLTPEGNSTSLDPNGKFDFANIRSGPHTLTARTAKASSPPVEVRIEDADISGLELSLLPNGDLTGVLEIVGAKPGATLPSLKVRPMSVDRAYFEAPAEAAIQPDGSFRIDNMPPGKFRLNVFPLPESAYIRSVFHGGVELVDQTIQVKAGSSAALRIVVSVDGGEIAGAVRNAQNEKPDSPVFVVLAAPGSQHQENRAGPDGNFSFRGLRPGKYRLLAVEPLKGGWTDFSALMQLVETQPEFEIKDGDRLTRDLIVTPIRTENAK